MQHPLSPGLDAATRFLLETICLNRGDAESAPEIPPTDVLAAEARRQLIGGLLHRWAEQQASGAQAQQLPGVLAAERQANAIRSLALVDESVRLSRLLRGERTDAIVLKGPLLSQRYYGDLGVRDAGDVDIFVDEAAAPAADRLLRDAGYQRSKPRNPLKARGLKLYLDTQHEFGYQSPTGQTFVELHWRFADCRGVSATPFSELWARAEPIPTGGADLHTLSPADTFVQLAIHGYTDGWSRLKWIADLPRVLAATPAAELPRLVESARGTGIGRIVELALALAGRPQAPAAWHAPVFAYIAARLRDPHPRTLPLRARWQHMRAANQYTCLLLDRAPLRDAAAYCNLIMPADFDQLPLPDAFAPALPYLARIHRAVRRLSS